MERGLAAFLILLGACSSTGVDLDVSTSVLDVATTTTEATTSTTSTTPAQTTTTIDTALEPILPDVATVVPIRPILLADDAGTRRADTTPEHLAAWVRSANGIFERAGIGFSYDPGEEMVLVEDTLLNGMTWSEAPGFVERVLRANEVAARYPGELVVMFKKGPMEGEPGSPHLNFVMMGEWADDSLCGEPDVGLLAHEIGRYLALPHTFTSIHPSVADAADTLADATQDPNAFDGDGFADTPPDPGVYEEHQCASEETVRIGGLEFELPRTNIMSHYQERSELSLQQAERARWMMSLRLANGMAVPSNTVTGGVIEAEDALIGTMGPCGFASIEGMQRLVGYQWVDADQLLVRSEEDCVIEFDLPVAAAGRYELIVLATRAPSYGAVELAVDEEPFSLEDLYAPIVVATGPVSVGETTLEAGTVRVRVEVVGSNTESSGGSVGIDGFLLRQLDP